MLGQMSARPAPSTDFATTRDDAAAEPATRPAAAKAATRRGRGRLVKWNDNRGFGFIAPEGGGRDVFVHISCFPEHGRRPVEGDRLRFEHTDDDRRPKATRARLEGLTPHQQSTLAYVLVGVAMALGAAHIADMIRLPLPVVYYLSVSYLTFCFYWVDKYRAERSQWRLTETSLHVLGALGGWPGAMAAQAALRHKTQKSSFQMLFWATAALHVFVWAVWFLSGHGGFI